ncbi:MAG: hypothetical protein IKC69_02600 [Clostridia bacterium]|nr:hypothetical protein [Clostridia bacterium]
MGLIVLSVLLFLLFASSATFNVLQYLSGQDQKKEIAEMKEENEDAEKKGGEQGSQIEELEGKLEEASGKVTELEADLKDSEDQLKNVQSELNTTKTELDGEKNNANTLRQFLEFYEKFIVFVSDDGTNRYHTYGCEEFDSSSFLAFNVDAAISQGYTPCPHCQD